MGDTLTCHSDAGASGYIAYMAYDKFAAAAGLTMWVTGGIALASAAIALFCVYNVLAGGNPPKKR